MTEVAEGSRSHTALAPGFRVSSGSVGVSVEGLDRRAGTLDIEAPRVAIVDTIGAGDSFQAGLLVALRAMGGIAAGPLAGLSADTLKRALAFAAACAAITCARPGADPPRLSEIDASALGA